MKEIRVFSPEFRATETDGVKRIAGYAAVFDKWSDDLGWFREKIAPGAFAEALRTSDPLALFNHNSDMVLGRVSSGTLRLKEDDIGLHMEVDLPDTQVARDLYTLVERGDIKQQSFGFIVESDQWVQGRNNEPDERTILRVKELMDVSPVAFPAYPDTTVAKRSKDSVIADNNNDEIVIENENIEAQLLINRYGV
jgi:hypothetical protein